jgi:hypothetical protein
MAWRQASCATSCAAYAVLLRDPLNPTLPALDHPMTFPVGSVIDTIVLLKVASTWATPEPTFLLPLALMIFGRSASPPLNDKVVLPSVAVDAAGAVSFFGAFGRVVLAGLAGSGLGAGVAFVSALGTGADVAFVSGLGAGTDVAFVSGLGAGADVAFVSGLGAGADVAFISGLAGADSGFVSALGAGAVSGAGVSF